MTEENKQQTPEEQKKMDVQDRIVHMTKDVLAKGKSLISKLNIPTSPSKKAPKEEEKLGEEGKKKAVEKKISAEKTKSVQVQSEKKKSAPPAKPRGIIIKREGADEREKRLISWASHINPDSMAFEQCLECNKYGFMRAEVTENTITFKCPNCNAKFTVKR